MSGIEKHLQTEKEEEISLNDITPVIETGILNRKVVAFYECSEDYKCFSESHDISPEPDKLV